MIAHLFRAVCDDMYAMHTMYTMYTWVLVSFKEFRFPRLNLPHEYDVMGTLGTLGTFNP